MYQEKLQRALQRLNGGHTFKNKSKDNLSLGMIIGCFHL